MRLARKNKVVRWWCRSVIKALFCKNKRSTSDGPAIYRVFRTSGSIVSPVPQSRSRFAIFAHRTDLQFLPPSLADITIRQLGPIRLINEV